MIIISLSKENYVVFQVGQKYKDNKKAKLQRTFVSASTAAEDRARGIKRVGGEIVADDKPKSGRIAFVPQGQIEDQEAEQKNISDEEGHKNEALDEDIEMGGEAKTTDQDMPTRESRNTDQMNADDYIKEMSSIKCLDVRLFKENMFYSPFGPLVLLIRPWARKLWNIQSESEISVCVFKLTFLYYGNQ